MRVFPWIRVAGDRDVAIWGIGQTARAYWTCIDRHY